MLILTNKDREDLRVLTQKLKSGELSPESPSEGANVPWTEQEKARFKQELERVFGIADSAP